MNKKGFTLIELLAAIVIMGVLSTIAVVSTSRYLSKSEKAAYETLEKTLYGSAQNYTMDHLDILNQDGYEISSKTLINGGYIDELKDPKNNNENCTAIITVNTENNTDSRIDEIKYTIKLKCSKYTNSAGVVYPN